MGNYDCLGAFLKRIARKVEIHMIIVRFGKQTNLTKSEMMKRIFVRSMHGDILYLGANEQIIIHVCNPSIYRY
jgi:adenine-specific DNA methylase